jgi:hypothetical protein
MKPFYVLFFLCGAAVCSALAHSAAPTHSHRTTFTGLVTKMADQLSAISNAAAGP